MILPGLRDGSIPVKENHEIKCSVVSVKPPFLSIEGLLLTYLFTHCIPTKKVIESFLL